MFGEEVEVSSCGCEFLREILPKSIVQFHNWIRSEQCKLHTDISLHQVGQCEEYFTWGGAFILAHFLTFFCDINFVNFLIDVKGTLNWPCVSIIFRQFQRHVNSLSHWVMNVKTYHMLFTRIKFKHKVLVFMYSQLLMMSDTWFKLDVGIFCWYNHSEVNKLLFLWVYLSHNYNIILWL